MTITITGDAVIKIDGKVVLNSENTKNMNDNICQCCKRFFIRIDNLSGNDNLISYKLRRCPKCNSENIILEKYPDDDRIYIRCLNCTFSLVSGTTNNSPENLIEGWNNFPRIEIIEVINKFKPCPFCVSTDVQLYFDSTINGVHGYSVKCNDCCACMNISYVHCNDSEANKKAEQEMTDKWNRRV
jgi:Lar family restriction alleviation protein